METLKTIGALIVAAVVCLLVGAMGIFYLFTEMLPSLAH